MGRGRGPSDWYSKSALSAWRQVLDDTQEQHARESNSSSNSSGATGVAGRPYSYTELVKLNNKDSKAKPAQGVVGVAGMAGVAQRSANTDTNMNMNMNSARDESLYATAGVAQMATGQGVGEGSGRKRQQTMSIKELAVGVTSPIPEIDWQAIRLGRIMGKGAEGVVRYRVLSTINALDTVLDTILRYGIHTVINTKLN